MFVEQANFSGTHQTQSLYSFPVLIEIFILFLFLQKKNLPFFILFFIFYVFFLELILSPTKILFTAAYHSTSPLGSELQQLGSSYITNVSKPLHIISTYGPFGLREREEEQSRVKQIQHKINLFLANSTLLPSTPPTSPLHPNRPLVFFFQDKRQIRSTYFQWQQLLSLKPCNLSKFYAEKVMGLIVLMCKALF